MIYFGVNVFQENSVEKIFGWEVNGLCRKVSDDIRPVTSPEWNSPFFFDAATETINYT